MALLTLRPAVSAQRFLLVYGSTLSCLLLSLHLHCWRVQAAGLAARFHRRTFLEDLQAVSLPGVWDGFAAEGVTIEVWLRSVDPLVVQNAVFTYGVRRLQDYTVKPKELALSVCRLFGELGVQPVLWYKGRMLVPRVSGRGGEAAGSGASLAIGSGWTHVVATLDYQTGSFVVYLNGTVSYTGKSTHTGRPEPWGELIVGAELIKSPNLPTDLVAHATSLSDLDIDQFRIYSRVLGPTEVSDMLWKEPVPALRQHTVLDWGFDDPIGAKEMDLSGNGADGVHGAVPSLDFPNFTVLSQSSQLSTAPVVRPELTNSAAPRRFNPSSAVYFASLGHPASIQLYLPGNGTAEVLSPPAVGHLELADGSVLGQGGTVSAAEQLLFHRPAVWPENAMPTEFTLSIAGQLQSVAVYPGSECTPSEYSLQMAGSERRLIMLGGQCSDGLQVQVEFPEAPKGGRLFSLANISEQSMEKEMSYAQISELLQTGGDLQDAGIVLAEITGFPQALDNMQGVVIFQADTTNVAVEGNIAYRWLSPPAPASATAHVIVQVTQQNIRPEMNAPTIVQFGGGLIKMKMESSDPDGLSVPYHQYVYRVLTAPRFGALRQVAENGQPGLVLDRLELDMPSVRYYAEFIPPYSDALGPSWTSQATPCGECCHQQATCNPAGCAARGVDWRHCTFSSLTTHSVLQVLGQPASSLGVDLESTTYRPHCTGCGRHWFVVGIREALYTKGIDIHEVDVHGALFSIQCSLNYRGADTDWYTLWIAPPNQRAHPFFGTRVLRPPLCQDPGHLCQWYRFQYDTNGVDIPVGFDAVEVNGFLETPHHTVWSPEGELFYEPVPGIHFLSDDLSDMFDVAVSDCGGWSQARTVVVPAEEYSSAVDTWAFGSPQVEEAVLGEENIIIVDVSQAAAHLQAALELKEPPEFALELVLPSESSAITFFTPGSGRPVSHPGLASSHGRDGSERAVLTDSRNRLTFLPDFVSFEGMELHVWAIAFGKVYHLAVQLRATCPNGTNITECAATANDCYDEPMNLSFDPDIRACVAQQTAMQRSTVYIIFGIVGLVLIAVAFFFRRSLLGQHHVSGPPKEGEQVTLVITDIHGSTTLWDSYSEQVAHGIALHHECLRASLKKCSGYEIATEGDSFKCAFRTPEDAICWSVMVQLDLLCAPWKDVLEDGGHDALKDREDWANTEAEPVIGANGHHILRTIDSAEIMQGARTALQKGAWEEPLFSAMDACNTPFCKEWVEKKSHGMCCLNSNGAVLPVFRGPRVRIGIHTGVAESVSIHEVTKRYVYGGEVAEIAKAVSDTPCGGQIIMTSQTLAEIVSFQDLMERVAAFCAGWRHGEAMEDPHMPAALSVLSLGSHVIRKLPEIKAPASTSTSPSSENDDKSTDGTLPEPDAEEAPTRPDLAVNVSVPPPSESAFSQCARDDGVFVKSLEDLTILPAMGKPVMVSDLQPRRLQGRRFTPTSFSSAPPESMGEEVEQHQRDYYVKLTHSHELVMVLPWPLKARALFFPEPSSIEPLTAPWDLAPPPEGVTMVFTFVENWKRLKAWGEAEEAGALTDDLIKLKSLVSTATPGRTASCHLSPFSTPFPLGLPLFPIPPPLPFPLPFPLPRFVPSSFPSPSLGHPHTILYVARPR